MAYQIRQMVRYLVDSLWLRNSSALEGLLLGIVILAWIVGHILVAMIKFYGLEVEDAYIFAVSGRILSENWNLLGEGWLTQSVAYGSIEHPVDYYTFGGHYLGFPLILALIYTVFGYEPLYVSYVNCIAGVTAGIFTYFLAQELFKTGWQSLFLFAIAPAILAFHGTGLSEPFSSLIIVATVWAFICRQPCWIAWLLLAAAVLVKRENAVLFILPFIMMAEPGRSATERLRVLLALVFSIGIYIWIADPLHTIQLEVEDINAAAFSIAYIPRLIPVMAATLLSPQWAGLAGVLALTWIFIPSARSYRAIAVGAILVLYLILYVSHHRSSYFVLGESESAFSFFRYATNIFPLVCILGSAVLGFVPRIFLAWAVPILCITAILQAISLRSMWGQEENFTRLLPIEEALIQLPDEGLILSENAVIVLFLSEPKARVCDTWMLVNSQIHKQLRNQECFLIQDATTEVAQNERPTSTVDVSIWHESERVKIYRVLFR